MQKETDKNLLFDKFQIIECIKQDPHSGVYIADHVYLGKKIFLKAINIDDIPNKIIFERFKREAQILAKIDHPNIIKVLDSGSWKNFFYISFEYFESTNLRKILNQKSLNETDKKNLQTRNRSIQ